MSRADKIYYKKSWFSDRHQSLINLLFNIVLPENTDSLLANSKVKKSTIYPGLFGIYIMNDLTMLILIFTLSQGYNTLGCKTSYLQSSTKYWYYAQLTLFFVIYFIISIPYAEMMPKLGEAVPPVWTFLISFVVWLLANVMARLGETFAFYNPFFWPTPLTWFGFLGMFLTVLFVIDDYYNYYYFHMSPDSQITILLEYVLLGSYIFVAGTVAYIFTKNFYTKIIIGNESLIDFFFKLDSINCAKSDKLYKAYDKEIKLGSR
jgi:hypothetical protein